MPFRATGSASAAMYLILPLVLTLFFNPSLPTASASFGVDVSFPIHYNVSTNYAWLPHNKVDPGATAVNATPEEYSKMPLQPLGDKLSLYQEYVDGCREYYSDDPDFCKEEEAERLLGNIEQPANVVNFTDTGFKKMRAPTELYALLKQFWHANHKLASDEDDQGTVINSWIRPTSMVSVEDESLAGGGSALKMAVWDATRYAVEEWTGQKLKGTSVYGIRIYKEGHILSPHVDRLPLVCSAIVNVAQDVDEDWPLEVYDRDGNALNITMQPGDMVLYESHSLIHGRPFPLIGGFYANVFIHFEPADSPEKGELPSYIKPGAPKEFIEEYYDPEDHDAGEDEVSDWLESLQRNADE